MPPQPTYTPSGLLSSSQLTTHNGYTLKYAEPSEARVPVQRWRIYVFKGDQQIGNTSTSIPFPPPPLSSTLPLSISISPASRESGEMTKLRDRNNIHTQTISLPLRPGENGKQNTHTHITSATEQTRETETRSKR